jgi:hypothetical protein
MSFRKHFWPLAAVAALVGAGCHSAHVEMIVQNRTGAEVRLLEVDYPSASFGADSLAGGATMRYRIQVQGQGEVKVHYTAPDLKQAEATGPALTAGEDGRLEIDLLPGGRIEFHPELHSGN